MTRRLACALAALLLTSLLLASCAAPPTIAPSSDPAWSGKLSIRIERDPPEQTSAAFTLTGSANAGRLELFTPLGGKAAQLEWGANFATISDGKIGRNFPDVQTALREVSGADIPVASLFDWLQGKQEKEHDIAQGWEVDLSQLAQSGYLVATRAAPLPRIKLRVVLER